MLPSYYEFQNSTKILSGKNALENITYELKGLGASRPILLSDKVLEKIGSLQNVIDAMASTGMEPAEVYTDIPSDSSVAVVNKIGEKYKEAGCDSIIAVGGGSVIDTAKGVEMLISQDVRDLLELQGCESMTRGNHVPFIAVPTTSGTGSEMTLVAVIKNIEKSVKMEFISNYLLPDAAVLDPRMTATLPPKTTASTGFDALCHAIEAYSCNQKNPLSDAYATAAIKLVVENLEDAVRDGKNTKARLAMANASTMAGAAFSNSMVGMVHAIGHALGGVCRVPHGDAMTILLPFCMLYNYKKLGDIYGELLLYLEGPEVYAQTPANKRGEEAIKSVRRMERRLHKLSGLPMTLKDAKVDKKDFDAVARTALNDGAMLVNPAAVEYDDVIMILNQAYE
ncbi:MAG: iron-containing alcohol dehydrogenase [Faecalicatena sp.]|uniref:iron-containing alcohol dehydrogenase n=1 Tax=Faecalicatena sp. TaxID=2005360 RepID=UPI002590428B|nr:iron-containing alcohol dehydrogenase [Faecalicatena sp.]MCI6466729.1 iron-containing alcohol dehydrogenase [Faecalicatena sp.]MCI7181968.1 iron-containing alcohol dehydrogenase [Lachnospiraceae bacterium]MDY5619119.1 iron-containing alcohol dehydrogenase [Lachnospiraceae bacterium]